MAKTQTTTTDDVNSTTGTGLPDRRTLIAFLTFVVLSGGASVAIRFTYGELQPFYGSMVRFGIGALVFWVLAWIKKIPLPRGRALIGAVLFGVLGMGVGFALVSWGLVATPASTYQILMASVPLLTLFLAFAHRLEPLRVRGIVGSLLTVAGIVVVVGGAVGTGLSLPHIIAILLAAAAIAEANVVVKKFPPNHPIMTSAVAMTVGALILGALSLAVGEAWVIPQQMVTWIALLYLILFLTLLAFFLYLYVLGRWTASGTSYGFVLVPLITVVLASWLAGEQITVSYMIGSALVLLGVYVGALMKTKEPQMDKLSEPAVEAASAD